MCMFTSSKCSSTKATGFEEKNACWVWYCFQFSVTEYLTNFYVNCQDDSYTSLHVSFCEADAAVLAALDVSLSHTGINSSGMSVENPSRSELAIGSNVAGGLKGRDAEELQNSGDLFPECCRCSCSEAKPCCDGSHVALDAESSLCRKVSAVTGSCPETSNHLPGNIAGMQNTSIQEVKSMNSGDDSGKDQLSAETDSAETAPQSAAVVQRRSAGRLSEKIKRTLQQNAKLNTPTRLSRLSAVIEKCDVRLDVDTDPFCGLPDTVRHLLQTQRSIAELYRMFPSFILLPLVL